TITAEDDVAVNFISWETNDSFSRQPSSQTEDCDLQKTCSVEFEFASGEDGLKTVSVYATDSSGNESQKSGFEVSVRPFDYIPSICGDDICKSSESFETCPADCEELIPDCGDDCASEITGSEGLTGGSEETCTTDSSCGYKKACIGGKCTSVQCTNDAQCGSGKECENNRCARCPVGASGFYAC
ncbi:MAG TPA: hypothetical protein VFF13_04375, partial [archaeon]|nr:hypothetical protein [archaeon]